MSGDTTLEAVITTGPAGPAGYRRLVLGPGESMTARTDLGGAPPGGRLRSLLSFVHLSDLHVTDAQSPARAEYLDRLGDADSPVAALVRRVGTDRAQEALSYQVLESMARAARRVACGPATGAPPAFAVSTGDATDNCQANELAAYLALLDGGSQVRADSGDYSRYEGVGSAEAYDRRYWHPDGTPAGAEDDLPRVRNGFPVVPGLLDACRIPFPASGVGLPWYAVYGNHDALFGGTLPPVGRLGSLAIGDTKSTGATEGTDLLSLLVDNERRPSFLSWGLLSGPTRVVTADPSRRAVGVKEWVAAHLTSPGAPTGHGFDAASLDAGRAYYAFDAGEIRCVVLDTVNPAGGWQGSIDGEQFAWLEEELIAGHRRFADASGALVSTGHERDRLFVLFSHHPLDTLVNGHSPDGEPRHLRKDVAALLARFPNVVCWVNGHTHENKITARAGLAGGFFEVTTASHIDWPQQSRLIEIAVDEESGDLVIAAVMVDHDGVVEPRAAPLADPVTLAGWSRELSANAWQGRRSPEEPIGRGEVGDRNVVLALPAPFRLVAR